METTKLLDSHKFSLISDEVAFSVLSWLLRSSPSSFDDITSEFGQVSHAQIRKELQKLYQSGFVEFRKGEAVPTSYAYRIMSKMGVVELAAKSLVNVDEKEEYLYKFLHLCLQKQSAEEEKDARVTLNLLKSLVWIKKAISIDNRHENDDIKSVVKKYGQWTDRGKLDYVFVVGLNEESNKMGGAKYVDSIFDWHERARTIIWQEIGESIRLERSNIIQECRKSFQLAEKTNILMSGAGSDWESVKPNEFFVSAVRLVNTCLHQTPDFQMYRRFSNSNPHATFGSVENNEWVFLYQSIIDNLKFQKNKQNLNLKWFGKVLTALRDEVAEVPRSSPVPTNRISHKGDPNLHSFGSGAYNKGTVGILAVLRGLDRQLNMGAFDHLTDGEKAEICSQFDALAFSFKERLQGQEEGILERIGAWREGI